MNTAHSHSHARRAPAWANPFSGPYRRPRAGIRPMRWALAVAIILLLLGSQW